MFLLLHVNWLGHWIVRLQKGSFLLALPAMFSWPPLHGRGFPFERRAACRLASSQCVRGRAVDDRASARRGRRHRHSRHYGTPLLFIVSAC